MGSPHACRRTIPCGRPASLSAWQSGNQSPAPGQPLSGALASIRDHPLKSDLHATIKRNWLQGRDRAWIVREADWRRELRIGTRIEESAVGCVSVVEDIVDEPEELNVLVELIGSMQVRDPIERQFGVLVGVIADKILSAGDEHIVGTQRQYAERSK